MNEKKKQKETVTHNITNKSLSLSPYISMYILWGERMYVVIQWSLVGHPLQVSYWA
jgi:hypothetical protein